MTNVVLILSIQMVLQLLSIHLSNSCHASRDEAVPFAVLGKNSCHRITSVIRRAKVQADPRPFLSGTIKCTQLLFG